MCFSLVLAPAEVTIFQLCLRGCGFIDVCINFSNNWLFSGQNESRILGWAASFSAAPSLLLPLYMPITLVFMFLEHTQLSLVLRKPSLIDTFSLPPQTLFGASLPPVETARSAQSPEAQGLLNLWALFPGVLTLPRSGEYPQDHVLLAGGRSAFNHLHPLSFSFP